MLTAMIPVGLLVFGSSSGPGGLVNLVAIPLVTFLVVPTLLLSLLLGVFWEPGAIATLAVPSFLMETLWSAMAFWEAWLPAWSPRVYPGTAALLLCLLAAVLLALPGVRVHWTVVLFLLAPLPLAAGFTRSGPVSVVVFDVGQGTAVLVRDGDAALLYDTGPGPPDGPPLAERTVLPGLARLGVASLEMLVVSHPDRDHAAGESMIRDRLAPTRIRRGRGGDGRRCRLGGRERLGRFVTLQSLSVARPGDSDNNASCVLIVEARGRRFLLPGDIDDRRERALVAYWRDALRADVLLAPHHGSGSSSSHLFLRTVDPLFLVVTAARANHFGHPADAVLKRAAQRGITVLNTAFAGAIEFRIDATGALHCRRYRHALAPFWRTGTGRRDCGEG
jgi:competence protein ComEC